MSEIEKLPELVYRQFLGMNSDGVGEVKTNRDQDSELTELREKLNEVIEELNNLKK